MPFSTSETSVIQIAGGPQGLILVDGTYTNSGGSTGGVIAAGYTNTAGVLAANGNSSIGGRKIISATYTPDASDATAPGSVKSYNTTIDADVETLVTTANSTGRYSLLCENVGR